MIIYQKDECSYNNWYKYLDTHTTPAILEEIPADVLEYLLEDGVVLPQEATYDDSDSLNLKDNYLKGESVDWNLDLEDDIEIKPPTFPKFSRKLEENLKTLGGSAFIKLNWSAPTDAVWITSSKSLKCSNLEDIYLLLKSSDKISNDLQCLKAEPNEKPKPKAHLVLKKWIDVHPGTEFRCFVAHNKLIGLTPRHAEYHGHLSNSKFDVINDIDAFFNAHVKEKFPLENYVFDVVRPGKGNVILIDFHVFGSTQCKPYLFTWEELFQMKDKAESSENVGPEFRYIGKCVGIQPNFENHFGIPKDVMMLANQYKGLSLIDIIQMEVKQQGEMK